MTFYQATFLKTNTMTSFLIESPTKTAAESYAQNHAARYNYSKFILERCPNPASLMNRGMRLHVVDRFGSEIRTNSKYF